MPHIFNFEIYYEDTDMGGIVYYANYLKFIERARSNLVNVLGIDQLGLSLDGAVFVVRDLSAEFLAPARMGDKLRVETDVLSGSHVRLILQQNVWRKTHLIFRSKVTIVSISSDGKPKKLPAKIRQISQL